jgi:CBS-domain-containing membrane protein
MRQAAGLIRAPEKRETMTTSKPLLALTAADVMSREVLTIPRQMSLRAAAHQLVQAHVSGAPVIDERGRCVGVLSTTDLARWLDRGGQPARPAAAPRCFCSDWQVIDPEGLPPDPVSRYMTADPVTATPDTPVGALARRMLDAHVHRVIIADPTGRPVGIVSTTDVLAAVARFAERMKAEG